MATSNFVGKMDSLFNAFNINGGKESGPFKHPINKTSTHIDFLKRQHCGSKIQVMERKVPTKQNLLTHYLALGDGYILFLSASAGGSRGWNGSIS